MPPTIETLELALENASTPREEIDALFGLCKYYGPKNQKRMLEYAEQAEGTARRARMRIALATALKHTGRARYLTGDYARGVADLQAAFGMFEARGDRSGMVETLSLLSMAHGVNGALDEARECLVRAEAYCDLDTPNLEAYHLFGAWSGLYKTLGNPEKMLGYARKLLAVAEAIGQQQGVAVACYDIGFVSIRFGDVETGLTYLNRAADVAHREEIGGTEIAALDEIAGHYLQTGALDTALEVAVRAQARAEEIGSEASMIRISILITRIYAARNECEQALAAAKQMTGLVRQHSPVMIAIHSYITRGDVHATCGPLDDGVEWYERAIEAARKAGSVPYAMEAQKKLADLHEKRGDLVAAFRHYQEYMAIYDGVKGFMKQKAVASAVVAMEMERVEREKEALQSSMARLVQEIERKKQELTASALRIAEKDELLDELRSELKRMLSMPAEQSRRALSAIVSRLSASFDAPHAWEEFNRQFQMADPDFVRALTERFGALTPTELKICSLLRVNLTTKDIASLLSIQPESVDIYRSKIRRKLGLGRETNLTTFLGGM